MEAQAPRRPRIAHLDGDGCAPVAASRGAAAHGFFQSYASCEDITQARFLSDPAARTPAFVRFSSVLAGRRGADTVRDVRGFAVKLFTADGNFDLVGQSFPVLHLEPSSSVPLAFPDRFFAGAPDLHELPFDQAPSFTPMRTSLWEYAAATPGTASALMWLMSDRALPRSLRMMEGFGVHTYRLVDERGVARLCRFHWRPLLGVHALDAEEAEELTEEDPDFHRRDLWDAIEDGDHPEWELRLQLIDEQRARAQGVDLLDASQELPASVASARAVGKLTLTRNPQSFYAELEQIDFHPSRVVPGIDFTNDPMLQKRLVAGTDPVGLTAAPAGKLRRRPTSSLVTLEGAKPAPTGDPCQAAARFVEGLKGCERRHLVDSLIAELRDLPRDVLVRSLDLIGRIDAALAAAVRGAAGVTGAAPAGDEPISSGASIRSRRVAVLVADGVCAAHVDAVAAVLAAERAHVDIVAYGLGSVTSAEGTRVAIDHSHHTASSIFYDAVVVPGGAAAIEAMAKQAHAINFLEAAYRHGKPIGVLADAVDLLAATLLPDRARAGAAASSELNHWQGIVSCAGDVETFTRELVAAMGGHRFFDRPPLRSQRAETKP